MSPAVEQKYVPPIPRKRITFSVSLSLSLLLLHFVFHFFISVSFCIQNFSRHVAIVDTKKTAGEVDFILFASKLNNDVFLS
jgi:hypothetical protein